MTYRSLRAGKPNVSGCSKRMFKQNVASLVDDDWAALSDLYAELEEEDIALGSSHHMQKIQIKRLILAKRIGYEPNSAIRKTKRRCIETIGRINEELDP